MKPTPWDFHHDKASHQFPYGRDETTYLLAAKKFEDFDTVEDWGCGVSWFSKVMSESSPETKVLNIDGAKSKWSDVVADLTRYETRAEGIFIRHVLEHSLRWDRILRNALKSFERRLVVIVYTPIEDVQRIIREEYPRRSRIAVPVIALPWYPLFSMFQSFDLDVEKVKTKVDFGEETIFTVERF